jgi:hypothetical protein
LGKAKAIGKMAIIGIIIIIIIIAGIAGYYLTMPPGTLRTYYTGQDVPPPGGVFKVETTINGVYHVEYVHNTITTIGISHARDLFGALNSTLINSENRTVSLALSNDTSPSASWTKLPNEVTNNGLDRKGPTEVTITFINGTSYSTYYEWTATGSVTVQCVGVHWWSTDASDNNLYACGAFTQTALASGDKIVVTYTLNYASG